MNGGKNKGYTIIEVMIFLAISGFMFVMAAIFINGKQAHAEFTQGMNAINSQIRTVMNDVVNGFYPSNSNFNCSATSLTMPPQFSTLTNNQQGTNKGCTFLGKVIQFDAPGPSGHDGTQYDVYTVAGRQYAKGSGTQLPKNFSEAMPTAVDTAAADLTDHQTLGWGVRLTAMYSVSGGSYSPIGAIGFFGSVGNFSGGNLQSGSQSVVVATVPGSTLADSKGDTIAKISNITDPLTEPDIVLCFDGGKGQKASITIGGDNGQVLTTHLALGGIDPKC